MIIEHRDNFVPLTKCRKIFYTAIFIATFLIHAPIFILVKTLRKLLHCILIGLEVVDKVGIYLNDEITVKKNYHTDNLKIGLRATSKAVFQTKRSEIFHKNRG